MELSTTTLTGLEAAASSTISDNSYARLVSAVFQCAAGLADQSIVEGTICMYVHLCVRIKLYSVSNIVQPIMKGFCKSRAVIYSLGIWACPTLL